MADNAVLGIKVEADGADKAAEQIQQVEQRLSGMQAQAQEVSNEATKLAGSFERAMSQAADATKLLDDAEKALWTQQQRVMSGMAGLGEAIDDIRTKPIIDDDNLKNLKEADEELDAVEEDLKDIAEEQAKWGELRDKIDGITDALKGYAQALADAYKPLEEARQKLKFFSSSAEEAEDNIRALTEAAVAWGQNKAELTEAAVELAKSDLDIKGNLEGIIKAAVASHNELGKTAETFAKAATGDAAALKELQEEYKLNTYQIKLYGVEVDKAGKVSAETADEQKRLAAALSDIARIQYGDAIAEQQATLAGSIENLERAIDNAKMTLGESVAPVIQRLTDLLSEAVNQFNKLSPEMQKGVSSLVVFTGSLLVGVAALAKMVTWLGTGLSVLESWATTLVAAAPKIAETATATEAAAAGTGALAAKAAAATPVLLTLVGTYEAIAVELAIMYQREQQLKQAQLIKDSRIDVAYNHALRDINNELSKIGLKLSDINDKAKSKKIIEYLGDAKRSSLDLSTTLDALNAKLEQQKKLTEEQSKEIKRREAALKAYREGNAGVESSRWYGNLDYYNAKIDQEGLFGYGSLKDGKYTDEAINKEKEQLKVNQAIQEVYQSQVDILEKATKWRQEEAERTKRILENEKQVAQQKRERAERDRERSGSIKEQLANQLEQARGLTPTEAGVKRANELIEAYKRIGQQNEYFIGQQKELGKAYEQGLKSLEAQAAKLEKARVLAEQKAEAEKIFTAQAQAHDSLRGKSLEEQKQGLEAMVATYRRLLETDTALKDNAENRKKAESEIKKLTEERLGIEKQIADLQKTAAEKQRAAQLAAMEQEKARYEAEAQHYREMGKTAEAEAAQRRADETKAKIERAQYEDKQQEIEDRYQPLLAQAKGNDAVYNRLLDAKSREMQNLSNQRQFERQRETWAKEEQQFKVAQQQREQAQASRTAEVVQIDRGTASLDKLATSADRAATAVDRQASAASTANYKGYGVEARVENGQPVEIISREQSVARQSWAQQVYRSRRDYWDSLDWYAPLEAVRAQQAAMHPGPTLPAYGTPIPKGQVGTSYTTYNLQVNGQNAAGAGSVDYRQTVDASARLAAQAVTSKLNQQFGANSLY